MPLGSIAMSVTAVKWAVVPTPLRKAKAPLPAIVMVAPLAMSTRRMRRFSVSCDAHQRGASGSSETSRWHGGYTIVVQPDACAVWGWRATRRCGPGTHCNEHKVATRGHRDAKWSVELGAFAVAVAEASDAAARERSGLPGGEIDTAD